MPTSANLKPSRRCWQAATSSPIRIDQRNPMDAFFSYGFFQRALLAGLFVAIACAILGLFLILRRDAMIGHGLAHVTFGGVALGLFLNILPLGAALGVAILASLAIMKLKEKAGLHGDTAIGIFSSVGMAMGIVLATLAGRFHADLLSYLFGDILAIDVLEVGLATVLAALVVIPAGAGLLLAASFKQALLFSSLVASLSVVLGLLAAFQLDLPASATVVLTSFLLFGVFFLLRRKKIS